MERWFCRNDEEWIAIAEALKLTACPHCKVVGTLVRHGFLYGFDETSPNRKAVRARRVFCSNRNARAGCGQTFSVWFADKIRRVSVTTRGLWTFLNHAVTGGIAAASRAAKLPRSDRTLQRLWKRFDRCQSMIRTALFGRCSQVLRQTPAPTQAARWPAAAQVLDQLRVAFPDVDCPVAAFQHAMRSFFV